MPQPASHFDFSRRRFLQAAAALPLLGRLIEQPAYASSPRSAPPYLALAKDILPGNDEFPGERAAAEIAEALDRALASRQLPLAASVRGGSPLPARYDQLAEDLKSAVFSPEGPPLADGWAQWVESLGQIRRAQFYPLADNVIRFEVASLHGEQLNYRVGLWRQHWEDGKVVEFTALEEHVATAAKPLFRDVTGSVFSGCDSFAQQLAKGIPYWRSRLDPATGIDIYGSNGIAVGDIDGDGRDEIYVCQPGGLPNRLYKISPEGLASDITEAWGAGILDDTSAALFVDLRNCGHQDLVVLRGSGPVLLVNDGSQFRLRTDAFRFATVPAGGFTGMAAADFDRDGKLDLYLCCYVYFQSEAQYTYAAPYHDAHNGPPNFLFRNRLNGDGSGYFEDCTEATGMNQNNDRFSFAPAWCDFNGDGWPDLYVANDFGRKNLYVNKGGTFHDLAEEAGVADLGPGMSASWFDATGDGHPDLYVANMWTAAGQRIVKDKNFHPVAQGRLTEVYARHTKGNSLYANSGSGTFTDITGSQHVAFGRWAWSSGGHDLDNDSHPEIFVTCGMLTNQSKVDLGSFFWRHVVARTPLSPSASSEYENGWNAINQFIREDYSWNGREPNVLHVRRGNRYFDFSGVSGLDVAEDSRAFAVCDFDGDGRPDLILKSRLGPQIRVFQNDCAGSNRSIAFELTGIKSNRDAIGAKVDADGTCKWLEAGSGFLSQHSKRMIFGLADATTVHRVTVTWPSGSVQEFHNLATGHTYRIVEGSDRISAEPFRSPANLTAREVQAENDLRLQDTWFVEPLPLPEKHAGIQLLVLTDGQKVHAPGGNLVKILDFTRETEDKRRQYEVFRRYIFDWRAALTTPVALLLNDAGEAVRIYGNVPAQSAWQADRERLKESALARALPFTGHYIKVPKRDFYKFGAAFLWAGYPEQALPYLETSLRQDPNNSRVLVLAAQIELQAGRSSTAESHFRDALRVNPISAEAWSGLADILDARDDTTGALANYEKALAIKPDLLTTLLNAGQTAIKADEQQKAEGWYRRAFALDPQSADAANGLGLALAKQGHADEARRAFEEAIVLRKDYATAINNLGVLFLQQGKANDAIAAFEYGIRAAPDEDILYLNLGRTYTRLGDTGKARQVMQNLLDRKPDNATALRALQDLGSR